MMSKTAPFRTFSSTTREARHCRAFVCLASLALGAGCSASADIPEVVVTRSDVGFEGVPVIPGITDVSQTVSTTFDHPSDFELPDSLNPELRPLSASVAGHGELADLSFLEGLQVTLSSRAPGAPEPRILAYYERPANGQAGRVLKLQTNVESDVLSYWDTDQAYYDVTLWGIMPSEDWAIDVTFAFSGSISVSTSD
jgi:hypothetical protein